MIKQNLGNDYVMIFKLWLNKIINIKGILANAI